MLDFLDVIWLFDRSTDPQKWKMQVCIDYDEGWFLRINSRDLIRPCVAIAKDRNPFLDHDSFIDCSLQMIDEFEIELAIERAGILGKVDIAYAPAILEELLDAVFLNDRTKQVLRAIFARHLGSD